MNNCNLPGLKVLTCQAYSALMKELRDLREKVSKFSGSVSKAHVKNQFRRIKVKQTDC